MNRTTRALTALALAGPLLMLGACQGHDGSAAHSGKPTPTAGAAPKGATGTVRIEDAVVHVGEKGKAKLELTLVNSATKVALLGASSSAYAIASLGAIEDGHVTPVKGGVALPKGEEVHIDGDRYAVELEHPLMAAKADSTVPVRLLFDNGAVLDAKAKVDGSVAPS